MFQSIILTFKETPVRLVIGLGGNEGDVLAAFAQALVGLERHVRLLARSGVWRSEPQGPPQGDYLNAAVLVGAEIHPLAILAVCQRLEDEAGREQSREPRWGPRPLDLDLLITPGVVVDCRQLTLPHPRFATRRFALAPAVELVPDWLHPRLHRTLAELATDPRVAAQRCARLAPFPGA
jgi:2-amino-4-hydroxy-6-hydroxymethyldihydropteridine diphosphokinase